MAGALPHLPDSSTYAVRMSPKTRHRATRRIKVLGRKTSLMAIGVALTCGAVLITPPQVEAAPRAVPVTPTLSTLSAVGPDRIVPHRPFTVAVEVPESGTLAVSARRSSGAETLLSQTISSGRHSVDVTSRWLDVSAIDVSLQTGVGSSTVTTPVRTLRRAYPRVFPVTKEQLGSSWQPGCPAGPEDLRALEINHINYKGRIRRGRIVVATTALPTVRKALKRAFKADFRIRRMIPVDHYGGSDDRSMRADNTSAYACRPLPSGAWSRHAYGDAIDINPRRNPHLLTPLAPPNGRRFVDRTPLRPGMIGRNSVVTRVFLRNGWGWGAVYRSPDYQHFSSTGG